MLYGYTGFFLRINLSRMESTVESRTEEYYRKYLGGAGFISQILLDELPPGIDALSPVNKFIFALGSFSGLPLAGAGRHTLGAISPLTNGICKSEVGEYMSNQLKRAGYDALIIEGKADHPVYILILDDEVQILDASSLWGKTTKETEELINKETKVSGLRTAMIGPGGENLVRYACVMHGCHSAAGRGGLGAVMGSKMLKAVAVKGTKSPAVFDKKIINETAVWLEENKKRYAGLSDLGTIGGTIRFEELGNLPTRNWNDEDFPNVEKIHTTTIRDTIRIGMRGCYACPVKCKKVVEIDNRYHVDPIYGGPEYEAVASLGSNCLIDDLEVISKASELCNAYSLDTISAGTTIAFGMECYERGIITQDDTDGLKLEFGNCENMLEMLEKIAFRKGFGDVLAEGSARAAEKIGGGSEKYTAHVKGREFPMHDPRVNLAAAVSYCVDPQGPDHCDTLLETALSAYITLPDITVPDAEPFGLKHIVPVYDLSIDKLKLLKFIREQRQVMNSLVLCIFLPYSWERILDILNRITGWVLNGEELLRIGERIQCMFQLINLKQGLTSKDTYLPARFFDEPGQGDGKAKKKRLDYSLLEEGKKEFYNLIGWDDNGIPKPEKLKELEIE